MVVTIHQPEHLPWLGFFDKIRQADAFILLDHVPFRKNYFQNRNRIRGAAGSLWLTVPVLTKGHAGQAIRDVQINRAGSPRWREKCWTSLAQHYHGAPYWSGHAEFFESLYKTDWLWLVELNEAIITYLMAVFSLTVPVLRSSELRVPGEKSNLILGLCRRAGATVYLSGVSGQDYLDLEAFERAGIEVRFQRFHHPVYRQCYEPFLPCLSAVDLLFNYGPASLDVIKGVGVETMDHAFE